MRKKIFSALLIIICLTLTGCDTEIIGSVDSLMRPPKLNGESSYLQKAFEETAGESVIMKAPVSGENRSSYLLYDVDRDGVDEALVFYSDPAVDEFAYAMLLKQADGEWTSVSTVKGFGDEIYEVSFADVNGDGKYEIVISWTTLADTAKYQLSLGGGKRISAVYSFDGSSVKLIHSAPFTKMLLEDLNGDGAEELFFVNIDMSNKEARASGKIVSLGEDYSVSFDKSFVTSSFISVYNIATDVVISDGNRHTRIYVDGGISETGIITEIIDIAHSDFAITLPLYEKNTSDNSPTIRDVRVFSRDVDNDGIIEIPTSENLPGGISINDEQDVRSKLNLTVWSKFENGELTVKGKSIVNNTYGYMFAFPDDWLGKITAVYNVKNATLTFYALDENMTLGNELFSLRAFSKLKWEENNFGYMKFDENDAFVYGYIIEEEYKQEISRELISSQFAVIE